MQASFTLEIESQTVQYCERIYIGLFVDWCEESCCVITRTICFFDPVGIIITDSPPSQGMVELDELFDKIDNTDVLDY